MHLHCSLSILISCGIPAKRMRLPETAGSPMYNPQMLEPERIWPEMIHHEQHEQQRRD